MPNTLNGVNIARVAELSLDALVTEMFPLRSFCTDFSPEVKEAGNSITSRLPTAPAVQDMSASKTPGNNTTTAVTVNLTNFKGVVLGFTDLERTYTDKDLVAMFIKPAVVAIFEDIMAGVHALVLNANYPNSVIKTSATFDADAAADLAAQMSGLKIPTSPRALVLPPTFFANLVKDNAVQAAYAYGNAGAIQDNKVARIHGLDIIQYNGTIPANAEFLAAYAFHPSAIAIAARNVAEPPAGTWYGRVQNVTDPSSGLTLQVREYYNGTQLCYELAILWGVAKGNGASLVRIKTA